MSCYLKGVGHIASVFRIRAESKHVLYRDVSRRHYGLSKLNFSAISLFNPKRAQYLKVYNIAKCHPGPS